MPTIQKQKILERHYGFHLTNICFPSVVKKQFLITFSMLRNFLLNLILLEEESENLDVYRNTNHYSNNFLTELILIEYHLFKLKREIFCHNNFHFNKDSVIDFCNEGQNLENFIY